MSQSSVQSQRVRVGAVSYLNTRPLIYRFAEFAPYAELILDVPSRLADRLAAGDLDVALIPSVEALQDSSYQIVSDACIACQGPVLSVKLLSRVPLSEIRTLALDAGSRTSVALVQILLHQQLQITPQLVDFPIAAPAAACAGADAVLLIGDRAIHAEGYGAVAQWDLGQQWCDWTGLPFVFAMWTARSGVSVEQIELALARCRDAGLESLEQIAADAAGAVGLPWATCLSYLRDNLHFTFGPAERQGLDLFHRYAVQHGFIPSITEIG